MTWNYRIIKHVSPHNGSEWLAIHEVYYDEIGEPRSVSEGPISPAGETLEEIASDLKMMQRATEKPTLDYSSFSSGE